MIISQFFPIELEYPESSKIKKIIINIKDIIVEPPYYTENNGCTKIMILILLDYEILLIQFNNAF